MEEELTVHLSVPGDTILINNRPGPREPPPYQEPRPRGTPPHSAPCVPNGSGKACLVPQVPPCLSSACVLIVALLFPYCLYQFRFIFLIFVHLCIVSPYSVKSSLRLSHLLPRIPVGSFCHCVIDFCCAPLLSPYPLCLFFPSAHPSILLCPSIHSLNHPLTLPSIYIHKPICLSSSQTSVPAPISHPPIHSAFHYSGGALLYSTSVSRTSIPIRPILPYSRSPCLSSLESHPFPVSPPPSPDSVAALQSGLPPPSGHLRPSPSRPGPPHTRLGQTHQHPG